MATRKALVNVSGQISELPAGDTLDGAGGGGGSSTFSENIALDFGTRGDLVKLTVANSVITNANIKGFQFLWATSANHANYEDFLLEGITLSITNIVDNTSFDVVSIAQNGTWGIYNFKVLISY
jgi:hypothetical protein